MMEAATTSSDFATPIYALAYLDFTLRWLLCVAAGMYGGGMRVLRSG
jgi:hypothetical protein